MGNDRFELALAIGGAAGQGIATPGNLLARMLVRRGLQLNAYNAYQSIIRGGHIFLTIRTGTGAVYSHGDRIDLLICLNQDTMDRHLAQMPAGSRVLYNGDDIEPGSAAGGVDLCPLPVGELSGNSRNKLIQNTAAIGAAGALLGMEIDEIDAALRQLLARRGEEVVDENVTVALASYRHAGEHFAPYPRPLPRGPRPLAVWTGNEALAMGGAAAGVKFYCAYPMSPASGILHWMAQNARELDILVRQVEDEIGVANMAIGAAHGGCRAMCATSGGGFALMTEAVGAAAMMEIPVVFIDVMRAGPSTGVPTKTEQGDLWQVLGASQGDFERLVVAPRDALDAFRTVPELFNLCDRCQCPGILISDLLISEGTFSVDPDDLDMAPLIDRGELITAPPDGDGAGALADPGTREGAGYLRYRYTDSGVSPRAVPGVPGHVHVVATDEHDEDGVLISDEFTNAHKRRLMVDKRARKLEGLLEAIPAPELEGPDDAEVTLVGWGSTYGVIKEAVAALQEAGVSANQLAVKWIQPLHADAISALLGRARRTLIVENNRSGQFARYLRGETGFAADGHIRKYDGEPFMPHHIVDGVLEHLSGDGAGVYVPEHELTL